METQEILQGVHDWTNGKIVYDISVAHPDVQGNPTKYATLAAALGTNGANIPQNLRKGGMSVKFVHTSDNNSSQYVQYRYMSDDATTVATFTNVANWQGVDAEPVKESRNLIESGGVFPVKDAMVTVPNPIYLEDGNINSAGNNTANTASTVRFRTIGGIDCSGWQIAKTVKIVNKFDTTIVGNVGKRFYNSSNVYLGTSWSSEAALLRLICNKTATIDIGLVNIIVDDEVFYCDKYYTVATQKDVATLNKNIATVESNLLSTKQELEGEISDAIDEFSDTITEESSYNKINPENISYSVRHSINGKTVNITSSTKMASSGFIPVKEGETYCISGGGLYGSSYSGYQAGYYIYGESDIPRAGLSSIGNVTFYEAHGDIAGGYFTVPKNLGIKSVLINFSTNDDKTALAGNVQMEVGENVTAYRPYHLELKIKEDVLPETQGGGGGGSGSESLLDKYMDFINIHYPNASDKFPKFRQHWLLKDKDLVVVNTGTSLTARDYCTAHPDAAYRPPLMHTYNLATYVWDKLNWGKQQYRRYDAKTVKGGVSNYFTETGSFSTVETDSLWDDSSYRRCYTRLATSGSNSITFVVPVDAWQFNFIYRTDAQGCENCTIAITEGNGYMEVWNGSTWVEANGYTFSMREGAATTISSVTYTNPKTGSDATLSNVVVGGNTTYQKRLKMRCTTHKIVKSNGTVLVAGTEKNVTISGTGRMMYWGVEWSPRQYMITYINAARGSHGPAMTNASNGLIHYQDNEIWSFKPDLILTEDPIFNAGGGVPNWMSGDTPDTPLEYWYRVVNNFFFADNQVSMTARATTLLGENNVPEFILFGPYATALDGKTDDNGDLQSFPLSNGDMFTTADALETIPYFMKLNHSGIIYLDCIRVWMEIVDKVYGGDITTATETSGITGASLTKDGVHPNDNGSKVWARLVLPVLDFLY